MRAALAALALASCGWSEPPCADPSGALVADVACAQAEGAARYAERLAARPLTGTQRRSLLEALAAVEPDTLRAGLAAVDAWTAEAAAIDARAAAERRSREVWALDHDGGALAGPAWARARAVITDAVAVWSHDDAERLSLTEMDIEGWVRLASLCREVQGGPPLRVSIADRVELYHVARDRFTTGSPADRRALVAVGPYWSQVRNVWKAAAAERQQAWISRAPLPPPMTTESSGYFKAVLGGDVEGLVRSVYDVLGPFRMDGA